MASDSPQESEKDRQRYLVLEYFYQYNEARAGDQQWSHFAEKDIRNAGNEITHGDVVRAITYLSDKGLMRVTNRQGFITGEDTMVRAGITARGVDAIERPNEFKGILPQNIIKFINHGSMNVSQGDQQIVGGANSGILAQGNASVVSGAPPSFPADRVREELADHPEAAKATDDLDRELKNETPRASIVAI